MIKNIDSLYRNIQQLVSIFIIHLKTADHMRLKIAMLGLCVLTAMLYTACASPPDKQATCTEQVTPMAVVPSIPFVKIHGNDYVFAKDQNPVYPAPVNARLLKKNVPVNRYYLPKVIPLS